MHRIRTAEVRVGEYVHVERSAIFPSTRTFLYVCSLDKRGAFHTLVGYEFYTFPSTPNALSHYDNNSFTISEVHLPYVWRLDDDSLKFVEAMRTELLEDVSDDELSV